MKPKVSVVVIVYNGEKTIKDTLDSLTKQNYKNCELIVVDDGSIDNTLKIVNTYSKIKIVKSKHQGEASARNLGIKNSTGDIIGFCDSDCIVKSDWIDQAVKLLKGEIMAVGGHALSKKKTWVSESFDLYHYKIPIDYEGYVSSIPTQNIFYRRELFSEIGVFNENLGGAVDTDLNNRITTKGYKIYISNDLNILHDNPSTLKELIIKWYRHSYYSKSSLLAHKSSLILKPEFILSSFYLPILLISFFIGFFVRISLLLGIIMVLAIPAFYIYVFFYKIRVKRLNLLFNFILVQSIKRIAGLVGHNMSLISYYLLWKRFK